MMDDPHLQSTKALTGYEIEALDGAIGHVSDFLVDEKIWVIQYLLVETGHWYAGKEILISTDWLTRINCSASNSPTTQVH